MAHDDITPGQHWIGEIQQALVRCDALVALHHVGFKASQWCEQEVGWMLGRLAPVVPVRLGEVPGGFEGQVQAISRPDENAYLLAADVLKVLLIDSRTAADVMEAMVQGLINSRQFDWSNAIIRLWALVGVLPTKEQFHRLMKAENESRDVRDANAWPKLRGDLMMKYGHYKYEPPEETEDVF